MYSGEYFSSAFPGLAEIFQPSLFLSWDRLSSFHSTEVEKYTNMKKLWPFKFNWSAVLWWIKRRVYGQNMLLRWWYGRNLNGLSFSVQNFLVWSPFARSPTNEKISHLHVH